MFFFTAVFGVLGFITVNDSVPGKLKDSVISMSVFALFASVAYLGDTVMAIINYRK